MKLSKPMTALMKDMGQGYGWDVLGVSGPLSYAARRRTCEALRARGLLVYALGDYDLTDAGAALAGQLNAKPAPAGSVA